MHPPPFNPNHRLSDWPDCVLELRCRCGRSSTPAIPAAPGAVRVRPELRRVAAAPALPGLWRAHSPALAFVADQREVPAELDARQLAALIEGVPDGRSGGLVDREHAHILHRGGGQGRLDALNGAAPDRRGPLATLRMPSPA